MMGNSMAGNLLPKQSPPLRECFADSAGLKMGHRMLAQKRGTPQKTKIDPKNVMFSKRNLLFQYFHSQVPCLFFGGVVCHSLDV